MKNVIILAKKSRDKKELLVIKNVNKTTIAKIAKVVSTINLDDKYN